MISCKLALTETMTFLPAILKFTCAVDNLEQFPYGGCITVGYHEEGDQTATMTMSSTCTLSPTNPIVHTEYESFKRSFIKALEFGIQGFGVI
jgi:flavin reductase (DIM6/NTAB) family NADH-FMN oxidoreductase RutF